jgi:hypothetical protein
VITTFKIKENRRSIAKEKTIQITLVAEDVSSFEIEDLWIKIR